MCKGNCCKSIKDPVKRISYADHFYNKEKVIKTLTGAKIISVDLETTINTKAESIDMITIVADKGKFTIWGRGFFSEIN